ncbi:MAG: permease [Bacteroidales bacterium]|nr:permease [Bacteroidales bacterium]
MLHWIVRYIEGFIDLSLEMAPWLLLGFIFAGILHVYMPKGSIRKYMGGKNLKSVIYAALLGIPLPLCSCGVIPTGIAFHKEGASKGSTVSFLISTPQTGVDSILATYSLLGLPFAILRPIVALFSGIFGGAITNTVTRNEQDKNRHHSSQNIDKEIEINGKIKTMIKYAFHEFLMDIAKWLIIGLAVAALIALLLPDDFFVSYLHNEFLSMLIVLAASIPIYVCATGSIPIAAVLLMKGLSPGAALVFLMAGPATNTATMAVIGKAIDKKTLIVYLTTIIISAMVFGWFTNQFLPREWFTFAIDHASHEHELLPYWLKITSGILLAIFILNGYLRKYLFKQKSNLNVNNMSSQIGNLKIGVEGMTCNHCKMNVEKNISKLNGIFEVNANPDNNEVTITGEGYNLDEIEKAIEEIGYNYKGRVK